mgnify:CR=1 FL=1
MGGWGDEMRLLGERMRITTSRTIDRREMASAVRRSGVSVKVEVGSGVLVGTGV